MMRLRYYLDDDEVTALLRTPDCRSPDFGSEAIAERNPWFHLPALEESRAFGDPPTVTEEQQRRERELWEEMVRRRNWLRYFTRDERVVVKGGAP